MRKALIAVCLLFALAVGGIAAVHADVNAEALTNPAYKAYYLSRVLEEDFVCIKETPRFITISLPSPSRFY